GGAPRSARRCGPGRSPTWRRARARCRRAEPQRWWAASSSCDLSPRTPEEDALEGEEVGTRVREARLQPVAVAREEALVVVRREPPPVRGQQGPLDPFHDLLPRGEAVAVDLEADVLLRV